MWKQKYITSQFKIKKMKMGIQVLHEAFGGREHQDVSGEPITDRQ